MRCARQFNVSGFRKLGYETRIIALFDTDGEGLRSHTFLDVKNPGTGKWETQDPEFDLYWMSKSSGVRVSLADAAENLSDLEPCHQPGACGWELDDAEGKSASGLRDLLDIVCVTNDANGNRFCRSQRAPNQTRFSRATGTGAAFAI